MKKFNIAYIAVATAASCMTLAVSLVCLASALPLPNGEFPLQEKWSRQFEAHVTDISANGEGIVLAKTRNTIVAVSIDHGNVFWTKRLDTDLQPFPIIIEDSAVYFVDGNSLWALRLETGEQLWQQRLPTSHVRILDVSENYLTVNFLSDRISTYSASTGKLLWSLPAGRGYVQAFIDGNTIYVLGDEIQEVNAENGDVLWSERADIKGKGLYDDGKIYFIGGDPYNATEAYIVGLGLVDHKELWRTKLVTKGVNEITIHDDMLFLLDQGNIYAINIQNGDLIWRTGVNSPTNLAVVGNNVIVMEGFSRRIRALDFESGGIVGSLYTSWPRVFLSESQSLVTYQNVLLFSQGSQVFAYGD
jgi:outer membrane protein assembly factor BamB